MNGWNRAPRQLCGVMTSVERDFLMARQTNGSFRMWKVQSADCWTEEAYFLKIYSVGSGDETLGSA